jgi:hypothetical protein
MALRESLAFADESEITCSMPVVQVHREAMR